MVCLGDDSSFFFSKQKPLFMVICINLWTNPPPQKKKNPHKHPLSNCSLSNNTGIVFWPNVLLKALWMFTYKNTSQLCRIQYYLCTSCLSPLILLKFHQLWRGVTTSQGFFWKPRGPDLPQETVPCMLHWQTTQRGCSACSVGTEGCEAWPIPGWGEVLVLVLVGKNKLLSTSLWSLLIPWS